MKKWFTVLLAVLLVCSLAACGEKPNDDSLKRPGTSGSDSAQGGNTESPEVDFGAILAGNGGTDTVYGKQDAAAKQRIIDAGKEEGLDVSFGADGSMTVKDEDGTEIVQKADGTWTVKTAEGGEGQLGGDWPDNEFTKLVPKPDFALTAANTTAEEFTVAFSDATVEQMRAYTEKVKAAGFTADAETEDQELMGMVIYTYSASNASGYRIEIFSTSGTSGLTISK